LKKPFREWFTNDYLMKVNLSSQLVSGNRQIALRQERICVVAETIIAHPKMSMEELRKQISIELFVTMRSALDYINHAKMLIDKWEKAN